MFKIRPYSIIWPYKAVGLVFPVGLWSCQVRFCLRSSRKCKSENGDYCQPSWDYPNPKRNVAFHQITFILFSLKAKSEWVTFEKRVETFYTQQRTTFIISNGKITKVFDCYCSICLIVSVTFNILKMGYHRFFHLLVNLKVYFHVPKKVWRDSILSITFDKVL